MCEIIIIVQARGRNNNGRLSANLNGSDDSRGIFVSFYGLFRGIPMTNAPDGAAFAAEINISAHSRNSGYGIKGVPT